MFGRLKIVTKSFQSDCLHTFNNGGNKYTSFQRFVSHQIHDDSLTRQKFDQLFKTLPLTKLDDWYNIFNKSPLSSDLTSILKSYGNSPYKALSSAYPEHKWLPWLFDNVPRGYWENIENHKQYFDWVADKMSIKDYQDWYRVKSEDLKNYGGDSLLVYYYGRSLSKALAAIYPQYPWKQFLFDRVPIGYWEDSKNRKEYFEYIKDKYTIKSEDDWYNFKVSQIKEKQLSSLLMAYYGNSLLRALQDLYPETNWLLWKFSRVPQGFWGDMKNQRKFFDWAGEQLGIKQFEEWYSIKPSEVYKLGGSSLLINVYNKSLIKALMSVYSEHKWEPWRFLNVQWKFWEDDKNVNNFVKAMEDKLGIENKEQWNNVSSRNVDRYPLQRFGNLQGLLEKVYPGFELMRSNVKSPSKAQIYLLKMVQSIFPGVEVEFDYFHPELRYRSGRPMELDIWIPSMKLALEYQGFQHYAWHFIYGPAKFQQMRDLEKREACRRAGITLVAVPYWWDNEKPSLLATLHKVAPHLVSNPGPKAVPIPATDPRDKKQSKEVPEHKKNTYV